ncbi:MAG: diguanylate cyclase [Gammaproteobacteria bacterium]|nr:diguanylate cyclase [Gammaproteobacteria bacterium]
MTLKALIFLASFCYTLVIGGGMAFYRVFIAYPEIAAITLDSHKSDLKAIHATYLSESRSLQFFVRDWAKWDETYDFVNGKEKRFIERNVQSDSFISTNVDVLSIFNEQKQHLYTGVKNENRFTSQPSLNNVTRDIDIDLLFESENSCGLIRIQPDFAHFCSFSIQNSEEDKPSTGRLIFINIFSNEFVNHIETLSSTNISYEIFEDDALYPASEPNIEDIVLGKGHYEFPLINHQGLAIGKINIRYPESDIPKIIDSITVISILVLLILPVVISILVYFLFLRPMTFIFSNIGHMQHSGKLSPIKIRTHIREIDVFTAHFNRFIEQMQQYQLKLERDSNTDGLTNLFNRRYFDHHFDEMWRTCLRNGVSLCIIMMDIDYFKKYNDFYGHQKGDDALKAVSNALKHLTRRANETLARYGGEEFVLVIESITLEETQTLLERISDGIIKLGIENKPSDVSEVLTLSCGACYIEKIKVEMKDKKDAALKIADEALYNSKESGRNQFTIRHLPEN